MNRARLLNSVLSLMLVLCSQTIAAEYQWNVPVDPPAGKNEKPRAFLWIPPDCEKVRGVVFAQHNMEEEAILEHPEFRKTLAELGFAAIWVAPTFDENFRWDLGAGEKFQGMLGALAEQSGYPELTTAPVVPLGHSAAASLPWYFAMWKRERTLAAISVSGQWPYVPWKEAPQVEGRNLDGVPGIVTLGEYEWAEQRAKDGVKIRAAHPGTPISFLAVPADGHFAALDDKISFLCLYLKKAAQFRLTEGGLKPIDPTSTGWLVDRWIINKSPRAPAAPVADYADDKADAFWCFDEEHARATEAFEAKQRGAATLVGYVQNGEVVAQKNGTHQQVTLSFQPGEDGVTFKLTPAFLETVPEGRPEKWTGKKAGEVVEKPAAEASSITIDRITGPVKKVSADTWVVDLNRASVVNDRRGNEAWFAAVWPGDETFKRAVQQAQMRIPGRNSAGAKQVISFPELNDVPAGTSEVRLEATADSGLPVRYFVLSGPAEVEGDRVRLLPVPVKARGKPVKVTVVAWQFGRNVEPKVQSAEVVERSFWVLPAR